MNIFEQVLAPYIQPQQPEQNDYRDEEGYLCCGSCHTRREYQIEFDGDVRRVPVLCACRQQKKKQEEDAAREQQRRRGIQDTLSELQSQSAAIQPKAAFDQDDGKNPAITSKVAGYVRNFDKALQNNLGLILYGPPGTGKTFYAQCIADGLQKAGYFPWLTSIRLLSAAINQNYGENRQRLLRLVKYVDALILDDFGAERDTSFMAEQVFEIINTRYEAAKPLIVTTNLDLNAMASEKDIAARRVYERVMEMCAPLEVKGETRRRQIASRKMADLKDILGLEG